MEISRRVQTIIALVSGAAFGALLVATFMQNYYRNNIDQLVASQTGQTKQAEQPPAPSTTDNAPATQDTTPLAESTTTPTDAAPEQTTQAPAASTETPTEPAQSSTPQTASEKKPAAPTEFTYTAQAGDSYSLLARKAIQSYANSQKATLSPAQAVAAEAFLSESAGSPELNEGQGVTINPNDVKSVVERAQKLPAEELAIWNTYAQDVVFEAGANS